MGVRIQSSLNTKDKIARLKTRSILVLVLSTESFVTYGAAVRVVDIGAVRESVFVVRPSEDTAGVLAGCPCYSTLHSHRCATRSVEHEL